MHGRGRRHRLGQGAGAATARRTGACRLLVRPGRGTADGRRRRGCAARSRPAPSAAPMSPLLLQPAGRARAWRRPARCGTRRRWGRGWASPSRRRTWWCWTPRGCGGLTRGGLRGAPAVGRYRRPPPAAAPAGRRRPQRAATSGSRRPPVPGLGAPVRLRLAEPGDRDGAGHRHHEAEDGDPGEARTGGVAQPQHPEHAGDHRLAHHQRRRGAVHRADLEGDGVQIHAPDAGHQNRVQGGVAEQGRQMEGVHAVQHPYADTERAEAQTGEQAREDRGPSAEQTHEQGAAADEHDRGGEQPPVGGDRCVAAALRTRGRGQQHQRRADHARWRSTPPG